MTIEIQRLDDGFSSWDPLLDLILSSFAYMNDVIDPPSSALKLTPAGLRQKARDEIGMVAVEDGMLLGCIFCRPEPSESLYVGKLAVAVEAQGKGIGKRLMQEAERIARDMNLPVLRLDTRIELTGNHARFGSMGFVLAAERRHPGYDRTTFIEMRKQLA